MQLASTLRSYIEKNKNSKDVKRVGENFLSLTILNIINFGFPLVLIPYLTRVLGVEKYGTYAFIYAVINYFTIFVKYGFELSATKQVAIVRDDKEKLSRLFSSVLSVRLLFMLLSFSLLMILTFLVPKFQTERITLFYGFGISIGIGLVPAWFFQGMENMKFMTLVNLIIRILSTALIFLFIKEPNQYSQAIFFQSIGFIAGGFFSILIAYKKFKLDFIIPQWDEINYQIKDGWSLFLSTIGLNFYRQTNTIILGFFTSYTIVGYYAAAEKIIMAIQSMMSPLSKALFPYFGRKFNTDNDNNSQYRKFKLIARYYGLFLLFLSIAILILSPIFVRGVLGSEYINSISNIQILSFIIFFGGLNYYYGIIGLVNIGRTKEFTKSVWISGIFCIISCTILATPLEDKGGAIALLLAEILMFIQVLYHLQFNRNNKSKGK